MSGLTIPARGWVRFEVRARLGARAGKTWSLTVTRPGQAPRRLNGLACQPGWSSLDWIGFVSHAQRSTAIDLDDIEITNHP